MATDTIDIIIPTSINPDGLITLIKSIYDYTDNSSINKIVVVANGSMNNTYDEEVFEVINQFYDYNFPSKINVVYHNTQIGYSKAVNSGIESLYEGGKLLRDVVLLNDDCILLEQPKNRWIELLSEPIKSNKYLTLKVGITAPLVQYVDINNAKRKYALFFCSYITADCLNEVGLLDESLWSYYEDMDFCLRAEDKKYVTSQVCADRLDRSNKFIVGGFPIFHEGGKTHKSFENIKELMESNYRKVVEKHTQKIEDSFGEVPEYFGSVPDNQKDDFVKRGEEIVWVQDAEIITETQNKKFSEGGQIHDIFIPLESLASKIKVSYSEIKYKLYTEQARRIDGYMSPKELVALSVIASNPDCNVFVEIGSWMGRSSNAIAKTMSIKGGVLICVDTWNGTENEGSAHDQARGMDGDYAFSKFIENNKEYILKGSLVPLRMKCENAFELIGRMKVKADVIFLDADHSYEAVKKDIENSKKILNKGGFICGHDYSNDWVGVIKAVNESFGVNHNVIHETGIWIANLTPTPTSDLESLTMEGVLPQLDIDKYMHILKEV